MPSFSSFTSALGLLSLLPTARAGWNQNSNDNIVVYWGQNSGSVGQNRLSYYCQNAPDVDVINISFMVGITNLNLNLANVGNNCTAFPQAPNLLNCPQVAADITECQQTYGKTIMMSLFGSTYSESGFSSSSAAVSAAQEIWAMYGPVQSGNSTPRPFGNAVVDGFDFDLEDPIENNMEPFAAELRSLADASTSKKFYLSAAPQCPYPDVSDQSFLDGQVAFDWVNVQFYNNGCGVSHYPADFNWATWDNWAKTVSVNKNAKVLIGTPANVGGANAGSFPTDSQLSGAISLAKGTSSFGGVMLWDMAQLFTNQGYLAKIVADLGSSSSPPPPASTTLQTITRSSTASTGPTSPPSGGSVPQWGQCGGEGYTGPTQCQAPFTCVATSEWWSSCQ
ncbi:carbohydrate-binding module family 1 protein [Trichoderma novae-zelandiae]